MKSFIIGTLVPCTNAQSVPTLGIRPFSDPNKLFHVSGADRPTDNGNYRQLTCSERSVDGTVRCVALVGDIVEDADSGNGQIKNANVLAYLHPFEAIKIHFEMGELRVADLFPDKRVG